MMEEADPQVCRLCLSVVTNYEILSCAQQDMVQIVVPELVSYQSFMGK